MEPSAEMNQQTVWMLAVRDGRDRAAFGALFDFFGPRLKGFIMRSGTNGAQAEDIVQDVMLTVWRKAHLFDPHRAQVSAWIYQIARNRQIDVIRKERRPVPEELKLPETDEIDASQILAVEQDAAQLKAALAKLTPDQRAIIEQAYLGELTHQEISAQSALPVVPGESPFPLSTERTPHDSTGLRQL